MIQHITKPFKYFFKLESSSGFVLLFAAVLALFISNSNLSDQYFSILQKYIILGSESFGLKLSDYEFVGSLETNIRPSPWKSNIKTSKIQKFYKPHNNNQLLQSCKEKRRK